MGYNIHIGNAVPEVEWGDVDDEPFAKWVVERINSADVPGAPVSDDSDGNYRYPSYGAWAEFLRFVGLHDVFLNRETGEALMQRHPGIAKLTKAHVEMFDHARSKYAAAHPGARPAYCDCAKCDIWKKDATKAHDPSCSPELVRLDWLCFWTRWAVENCERPAIENS